MSDPTAPVEGAAATPETPAGPDFSPVLDRVNELATGLEGLQSSFQQFAQANQPEPEPEPDIWDQLWSDPNAEPEPQAQPQLNQQALQAAINQAIQSANAPLQQQLQQLQMERATQQLYQQIPQLQEVPETHPDYAAHKAARESTAQAVQQALQQYPPEVAQILSNDPHYIATIFKAAEAEKLAQGQAPAGEQVPSLEAAGGAHPGGNGGPSNPVEQIFANRDQEMPSGFR